jgi:ribose transport system substrate-binding protein
MKHGLRLTGWPLALLLLLPLAAGCSKDIDLSPSSPKTSIALILSTNEGDYWRTVKMGADEAAKEFHVSLIFNAPGDESDATGQAELVKQVLKSPVSALVLAANDYDGLAGVAEEASGMGVPVIAIDAEVNSPVITSYIGTDSYEAGRKAGQKMLELTASPSLRITLLGTHKRDRNTAQREEGVLDYLADYPLVQVADTKYLEPGEPEQALEVVRQWLDSADPPDGIIAMNTQASLLAAQALKARGLTGKVKLVTFDHSMEALGLLQEGEIQGTVIQNPYSMGYLGVKYAAIAAAGKSAPPRIDTGSTLIDLDNMFWKENQKRLFPLVK